VLTDALGAVVDRLGAGPPGVTGRIFTEWEAMVGPAVAAHVRPVKVDGPTLVVAVDHPAWATQVRALAPDILAKVQGAAGSETAPLTRLEARVRPPS
jgi:predicted nucleic acid-binding Zn ribbon protein